MHTLSESKAMTPSAMSEETGGRKMSKPIRDKKGHYRKFLDSVDEEIKTLREIRALFEKLEFKDSQWWVMRWLYDFYRYDLSRKP